jgi:anti-anti-sigma factor
MTDVECISGLPMTPVHAPTIIEHQRIVIATVQSEQCEALWKALEPHLAAGKTGVVLDLSRINFLDSVNIAAIIGTRNKLESAGVRFAVANLAPNIQAVFRILKLDRMFDLGMNLEQAITVANA